ncbi:aminotransferase class IV [Methylopila henanensis]|uniref:Probable branched-chain-amino-acid aminotransferase n=1 Tax=Methylopila henanensis TaxID=873516 RepID=A0ABW4K7K3_9HYPH
MLRLNGAPVDGAHAVFDLADRGLTLGDGLFETIPVFGGRPVLLARHLDRLEAAAAEIRLPVDRAFCESEALALAASADGDCVIRLTVTRGAGARGLAIPDGGEPTVIAAASPYPKGALNAPIRLATVSVRRNPTSFAARAKTLSYLDSVLAFDAARRAGADDALMLNVSGRVACTAMANLFAAFDGTIVTPPVSEGVLPGVIRALVLEVCASLGLAAEERPLAVDDLFGADAVFATNSVRLVMPATALDGRALGGDGDAAGRLRAAVAEACGASA